MCGRTEAVKGAIDRLAEICRKFRKDETMDTVLEAFGMALPAAGYSL